MVTLTINGQTVQVPAGTTILEAAEKAGIKIPTLCYLKDINKIAACRMCVVEVEGSDRLRYPGGGGAGGPHQYPQGPQGPAGQYGAAAEPARQLLLHLYPQRQLPAAEAGQRPEYPRDALPCPCGQGLYGHLHAAGPAGQQVHQVYALRPDLREGPDHGDLGPGGHRLPDHGGRLRQPHPEDLGLHLLRPVRHPLSHRRPDGPGRHGEGTGRPGGPGNHHGSADRAGGAGGLGGVLRPDRKESGHGEDGGGFAAAGLRLCL